MNHATLVCGDALEVLRRQPTGSAQCCVTSPPYWRLRDYGVSGQMGLEATPALYLERMVEVFQEVRRVLRKDGTLWLNMGDSYGSGTAKGRQASQTGKHGYWANPAINMRNAAKEKQLLGMPWRLALALQDLGWYLRLDIVWHKPNAMPESVRDRPTRAHEYLFLLSPGERYYYDWKAVAEPVTGNAHDRGNGVNPKAKRPAGWEEGKGRDHRALRGRYPRADRQKLDRAPRIRQNASFAAAISTGTLGERNARSVWTIPTQAYTGIHYATFPEELARRCVVAGSSAQVCGECGAPWARILGKPVPATGRRSGNKERHLAHGRPPEVALLDEKWHGERLNTHMGSSVPWEAAVRPTLGWKPTCKHHAPGGVGLVLDPFAGSGTTGVVALRAGRDALLIDLKAQYLDDAARRISALGHLLVDTVRA